MTAERWADIPAGCICEWTGKPAGWVRTRAHPGCRAPHGDES